MPIKNLLGCLMRREGYDVARPNNYRQHLGMALPSTVVHDLNADPSPRWFQLAERNG